MIECLENIVGVRGCGEIPSVLYVQQLTGISIADFDKAISNEKQAALPALQEIINFSTQETIEAIRSYLSTKYSLKSFVENGILGYYYDDKQIVEAIPNHMTGYQIRVDKTPYLSFYISTLSLFVDVSGVVDVKIYDLTQDKLLDTIPVTSVAGEIVTVIVNKTYYTHKQRLNLFIGYDSVDSYKTSYSQPYTGWMGGEWCNSCFGEGSYIYFRSVQVSGSAAKINANMGGASFGGGLSLGYSLSCTFDEFLCNIRQQLAFPILYKAGEKIMEEMAYSRRLNGIVTAFNTDFKELRDMYAAKHTNAMTDIMSNASIPDSLCFHCKAGASTHVNLP